MFPDLVIGRGVFLHRRGPHPVARCSAWRMAFEWLHATSAPRERLLLVGTSPAAVALARELYERRSELGVEIVGFVDPDPARIGEPVVNPGVIGGVDDIPRDRRASTASTASSSAWPTRAASCRWTPARR